MRSEVGRPSLGSSASLLGFAPRLRSSASLLGFAPRLRSSASALWLRGEGCGPDPADYSGTASYVWFGVTRRNMGAISVRKPCGDCTAGSPSRMASASMWLSARMMPMP